MRYELSKGERLIIKIDGDESEINTGPQSAQKTPSAIAPGVKSRKTLARRRAAAAGIQFFDFEQIPNGNGTFSDMQTRFVPAAFGNGLSFEPLEDSQWNVIQDEILAVENFENHSRLIEQPHVKYLPLQLIIGDFSTGTQIDLLTDPRFAANSFSFTAPELENNLITLINGVGDISTESQQIRLKDALDEYPAVNKFTLAPDFNADGVSYTVTNQDQIYLVPKFILSAVNLETAGTTGTPVEFNQYILNNIYRIVPRSILLDPANPFFNYAQVAGVFANPDAPLPAAFITAYQQTLEIQKTDPSVRAFRRNIPAGGGALTSTIINVADFPDDEINLSNSFRLAFSNRSGFLQVPSPNEFLLAIIVRGSQKFYVWKSE